MLGLRQGWWSPPRAVCLLLVLTWSDMPAHAASDLCVDAARTAAAEAGVPPAVMLAITLTETGRAEGPETRPWPWAVNAGGESHWFESADAAGAFAQSRLAVGATSFDLGCFQLNWRWHNEAFDGVAAMLEPLANARYAAAFLTRLYRESGDWSVAAGAYHSRTAVHANRYRARFDGFLAIAQGMTGADGGLVLAAGPIRRERNAFPLLQAQGGGGGQLGSLVPLSGLE